MVGIICPLVEIGLIVTQNLDKAPALEALVALASLHFSRFLLIVQRANLGDKLNRMSTNFRQAWTIFLDNELCTLSLHFRKLCYSLELEIWNTISEEIL